jgi:protein-disulfide isomerase
MRWIAKLDPGANSRGSAKETCGPIWRDFQLGFLTVLCACSLLLNAVLILYNIFPLTWRELTFGRLRPPPVQVSDHVRGDPKASVIVIEYADFQCPYCQQMHATLLSAAETGKIRWVFRNDPLQAIHPLAAEEAEAAECAGEQGKFWAYADSLFAAQRRISASAEPDHELAALAQGVNADPNDLQACLDSRRYAEAVKSAVREAESLQILGTPTIFVNEVRHEGTMSNEDLNALTSRAR